MPFVNTDWKDETLSIVDENGAAVSTTGWTVEMHIRTAPGAIPAALILKSSAGTLLVGQPTNDGTNNGISPHVDAAAMTMPPGPYYWDIKRTDGNRDEWLIGGDAVFEIPITVIGTA